MANEEDKSLDTLGTNRSDSIKADIPVRISPDDILQRVDKTVKELKYVPSPGLLDLIISKPARERKAKIEETKISVVKARKELIDGLANTLKIYVDTHRNDLRVRGVAFVTTTFVQLSADLNRINESTLTSFFETFSEVVDRINNIKNLDENAKKLFINDALNRAKQSLADSDKTYKDILVKISDQVKSITEEIGKPIK